MTDPISAERLRAFVQSYQHVSEEISDLQGERKDLVKQIKEAGIDVKMFKRLIERMAKDPLEVIEADALLESYEQLMGTGAQAAGTLATRRDADGKFVVEIVQGSPAEAKPTAKQTTRRTHIALAEAARRAREQ